MQALSRGASPASLYFSFYSFGVTLVLPNDCHLCVLGHFVNAPAVEVHSEYRPEKGSS